MDCLIFLETITIKCTKVIVFDFVLASITDDHINVKSVIFLSILHSITSLEGQTNSKNVKESKLTVIALGI